jgi:hypothetical protein
MPVLVRSRQARGFQGEDRTDLAESHVADQGLEVTSVTASLRLKTLSASRFRDSRPETLSVNLSQRADQGVSVFVADFAILVAVAIVETCLAHGLSIVPAADSIRPPGRMATAVGSKSGSFAAAQMV